MKDKKIKNTVRNASITLAVAAGTAIGVAAYKSGSGFNPAFTNRDFNFNQVHFSGDNDVLGQGSADTDKDSAIWEKDERSNDSSSGAGNPGYLFDGNELSPDQPGNPFNTIIRPDDSEGIGGNGYDGPVIDLVGDGSPADIIISAGDGTGGGSAGSNKGSDDDMDSNKADNAGSDNRGDSGDKGNDSDSDNSVDTDEEHKNIIDTAKDPAPDVYRPDYSDGIYKPYNDSTIFNRIDDVWINESESVKNIYLGQNIDNVNYIVRMLGIRAFSDGNTPHIVEEDRYGRNIRITGVSFDNGQSWNNSYPLKIPKDIGGRDIKIRVELKSDIPGDTWEEKILSYTPGLSRLYILSEKLKNTNQVIDKSITLNAGQSSDINSNVFLYRYQREIIGDGELTSLFPGWMEYGKLVSWKYNVTSGRHILEPAELVPLDNQYKASLVLKWLDDNGRVDFWGDNLVYLQTLTDVKGITRESRNHINTLRVPEYIQSVELQNETDVDYISIPDTVIYINNDGINLNVAKGYNVDKGNPNYCSDNGMLMDNGHTSIIAVPYDMENLDIPDGIESVNIRQNNHIKTIILRAEDEDHFPELDYSSLNNCKIIVDDELLDTYIIKNADSLAETGNCVAAYSSQDVTYKVDNNAVITSNGQLYAFTSSPGSSVVIPDGVTTISEAAFKGYDDVKRIVMPENTNVIFEDGCLNNSKITTILCNDKQQSNNVAQQLSDSGVHGISVCVMDSDREGYKYYVESEDNNTTYTLVKAPSGITEFNGAICDGTVAVDYIEDSAFAGCSQLEWVTLPESVVVIGSNAFKNCVSLQGVLIQTTDNITIGNGAFDGCSNIRFIASQAMNADVAGNYEIRVTDNNSNYVSQNDYLFVLQGAQGYGAYANSVNDIGGITGFRLDNENGNRVLYGVDAMGDDYVVLRAGTDLAGTVNLSEKTSYIYSCAFADSGVQEGFTINWESLDVLSSLYDYAFKQSGLMSDVKLYGNVGLILRNGVFAGCSNIENVDIEGDIYYLGEDMFAGCTSLKTAKLGIIGAGGYNTGIYSGLFNGCNSLTTITLGNETPPQLIMYGKLGFQFNYEWSRKEESDNLKVVIPDGSQMNYIKNWRYIVLGATGYYTGSPYLDVWQDVQNSLIDWDNMIMPEDSEVDAAVKEKVLEAENYIRKMTGQNEVSEPTAYFTYRENNGMLTLTGVPSYLTQLDMTSDDMGLPDGWYFDYIAANAFSGALDFEKVVIPDNLIGIHSGAFSGSASQTGHLTIEFTGEEPVELINDEESGTYSFGLDYSQISVIVPYGCKDTYVEKWSEMIDKDVLNMIITEKEITQE